MSKINKDKYIVLKSNEYAIKLINIFGNHFQKKLMEYVHSLLTQKEIEVINSFFYEEMKIFAKDSKTIRTGAGHRRRRVSYKRKIEDDFISDFGNDLSESILDNYNWAQVIEKIYLNKRSVYLMFLDKLKKILENKIKNKNIISPFYKNLEMIRQVFNLDKNEIQILSFLYLIENDSSINDVMNDDKIEMDDLVKSIKIYCRFFKISPRKMRDYLAKDSKLIKSGILEKNHRGLSLSEYVEAYLAGISRMDLVENFFKEEIPKNTLSFEDHIVPNTNVKSILSLLKGKVGCNILIFGKPGTGKTEFTKSLAQELNYPLFYINQYDEDGEENLSHRKSAIVAVQNILKANSIIVVDECDPIINTQDSMWFCEQPKSKNDSKAWINSILESTKHKIIWVANRTESIDVSTKRRFSFSQEFKDLTQKQRNKVWEVTTKKYNVDYLKSTEIKELSSKYQVNAGGISLAIQDINSIKSIKNKIDKKIMLENILKQHEKFVFGNVSKLISKNSLYDSSILNTSINPNEIFTNLKSFSSYINENPIDSDIQNMNILFYGPPGTGKTELVKHLADNLGVEILLKRLSDIRSKWYGESLQNIAAIFAEAQNSDKLLFIDEADSFFSNREISQNENHLEETNELLTQMENFRGILVCSTNMLQSLDQAVLRRFTLKVSFDYLSDTGKIELFKKYFFDEKEKTRLNQIQTKKLQQIRHLTPGDYKVVKHKHFFGQNVSIDTYITDLENESFLKKENKKRVGLLKQ